MFFFAIKEPKDRPNIILYRTYFSFCIACSHPVKKNALRAARRKNDFACGGPEFFELFQVGVLVAIKGCFGKVF
ncbi:MAG: hypothetical protein ACM3KF_00990 [Acidobacteriota bacterium]